MKKMAVYLDDITTQGFIAGSLAAIPEMIFTLSMYAIRLIKFRYLDFASTVVFNHLPKGLFQSIIAELIVWIFCGLLGTTFSLLTKHISNKNLIYKGAIYGITCWFFTYAVVTIYKVKPLFPLNFSTSCLHMVGGVIWGVSMVLIYSSLFKNYGQ